jgi:hypothetical protein
MLEFKPDWEILESLRDRFLSESFSGSDSYWNSFETLFQYHHTFAQRIGWKWESVLAEIRERFLSNHSALKVLDWGCGTGIASSQFLSFFEDGKSFQVNLWDRSTKSITFSQEVLQKQYPKLEIQPWNRTIGPEPFILLLSHVLNELSPEAEKELMKITEQAEWIFWVEPGMPHLSKKLISLREELRKGFEVIAPCPHQESCGLLASSLQKDWCHFFAKTPSRVFQESFWKLFSTRLKIDLRSLPTSFLVLRRRGLASMPLTQGRVLGRARSYKGYSLALTCRREGVKEEKLLDRDSKQVIDLLNEKQFTTWIP